MLEKLYTVKEVMELVDISRATLSRDMKTGKINFFKIGNKNKNVRFKESDVLVYKKEKQTSGSWLYGQTRKKANQS